MIKPIRIALTKGRLEKDTVEMFERLGYDCTAVREKGRRLILPVAGTNLEIVLAKAADVATYVDNGVCDIGVVGKDTIMEMGGTFYEVAGPRLWQMPVRARPAAGGRLLRRVPHPAHRLQICERGARLL